MQPGIVLTTSLSADPSFSRCTARATELVLFPSAAVPPCAGRLRGMLLALGLATGVERRLSTATRGMGSGLCNAKTEAPQL